MNEIIASDLYRRNKSVGYLALFRCLFNPCFRYVFYMRKVNASKNLSFNRLLYSYLKRRCSIKYGFVIISKNIGSGLFLGHPGTIRISAQAILGKNCNVAHNVTIGVTNRGDKKGAPIIADYVWIGTGAVIVGKITIGNNVLIAPNAFVNIDIPNNSIV